LRVEVQRRCRGGAEEVQRRYRGGTEEVKINAQKMI
jgi:hypothetical protein